MSHEAGKGTGSLGAGEVQVGGPGAGGGRPRLGEGVGQKVAGRPAQLVPHSGRIGPLPRDGARARGRNLGLFGDLTVEACDRRQPVDEPAAGDGDAPANVEHHRLPRAVLSP